MSYLLHLSHLMHFNFYSCKYHICYLQVSGSNDFDVKVWSYTTLLHHIRGQKSTVTSLSFKRGCIVSGAASGFINVWTQKGVLITSLVPEHRVNCCDLSVVMKNNNDDDATIDLDPGTCICVFTRD